jgi:GAF domain-containing protein
MYETALPELDCVLQSCHSARDVEAATERVVPHLFPEWSRALRLIDDWNALQPGAPDPADRRDSFTAADCWALRHGRIRVTSRSQAAPLCAHLRPSLPGTHFCVPLFDDNKVLGILHVFARGVHGEASLCAQEELQAKEALAVVGSRMSAALANLRRNSPLVPPSLDDFTGLFSRTHVEKKLERDLVRAETRGLVVSVMIIDLDHFEQFRDECGETAGGILVHAVARMIRSQTRPKDYACRYQRSEFALVMPEAPAAVAASVPSASPPRFERWRGVTTRRSPPRLRFPRGWPPSRTTPPTALRCCEQRERLFAVRPNPAATGWSPWRLGGQQ